MSGKSKKVKGTKETFVFVEEPKRFHAKQLKCANPKQKEFVRAIENNEITICTGIAGSGKTYVALAVALKLLEKKQVEKVVLVKSVQQVQDEEMGYLPGDVYEKMEPFLYSFFGNADKIIGEEDRKRLVGERKIEVQPLAYIRGINIDNACVVLDEAQNLSVNVFKSIITRIGKGSKYIIMGDTEQIDMKRRKDSVLSKLVDVFKNDPKVGVVEFGPDDCVRNEIIPYLLDKIKIIEDADAAEKQAKQNSKRQKEKIIETQINNTTNINI